MKWTSNLNLYWYRQAAGGAPQLLFHSVSVDQVDPEVSQNFKAFRPQDDRFNLSSEKLLLSDSGFYLCAASLTLSWVGQTSVQKLHPLLCPHHPHSGTGWRGFVTGFPTASQCESNCIKPDSQKTMTKFSGRTKMEFWVQNL